jgi:hypothetical protein
MKPVTGSLVIAALLPLLALAGEPLNQISQEERAQGWDLLFNGEDTDAWIGMDGAPFPPQTWTVEDGALRSLQDSSGGDLRTVDEYSNFELLIDWKIPPGGNSGIKYLVQEEWIAANFDPALPEWRKRRIRRSAVGPEYQLFDDSVHNKSKPGWELSSTGALYLLYAPLDKKVNPVGEWNTARIIVDGLHVEHWLNGAKILEYELNSKELLDQVKKTKFRQMVGFGEKGPGPIVLQHHGHPVWFRNIKIRKW